MPKSTARQASLSGYDLGDYIRESIDFLRTNEPEEGYFVGFSGGKDSITTLELCRLAGVKHQAYYSCTRIDPPEVVKFIRQNYPSVLWCYPRESLWDAIQRKRPPTRIRRWCCDFLKKQPTATIPLKWRVMGIRAEESRKRAGRPRVDQYIKKRIVLKPIFHWPEWAVWEFIKTRRLSYPSLYDEGFGRIGCVVCPLLFGSSVPARRRILYSMSRWPGIWKAYEHAVKRWFSLGCLSSPARNGLRCTTPDEYWNWYLWGTPTTQSAAAQANLVTDTSE